MRGVAIGEDGAVDPQQQLFRSSAIGVETGPFISQVRGSAGECGEPVSNFVYAEEKDTWLEGCLLFHATYGYVLSIACVSVSGPAHPSQTYSYSRPIRERTTPACIHSCTPLPTSI